MQKLIVADRSKNLPTGPNKPFDELHGTDKVLVDKMTSYLSFTKVCSQSTWSYKCTGNSCTEVQFKHQTREGL